MRRRRSGWSAAADIGLTTAAILGAVCIVLAIAAVAFDMRIILFRTGSMSPTIPAGSAAVVRHIPASDIRVGDVITVDRPGKLPVTHRVVAIEPVPGESADLRRITMRGDANAVNDPAPYDVREVRLVVFSVPGIAPVLASFGNPVVLGCLTLAASALIVVVFWPRRRRSGDDDADTDTDHESPPAEPGTRRARRTAGLASVAVCLALAGPGALAPASPAIAAGGVVETVVQGDVIRLVSIAQPAMRDLAPGTTAAWQVGVTADAPNPGTITVTLAGVSDFDADLRYDVRACPVRWTGGDCPEPEVLVADAPVPRDDAERMLRVMHSDEELWLLIEVTAPPALEAESGMLELTVGATGMGDDVSTDSGGLASTGAVAPWPLIVFGVMVLAVGIGLARRLRSVT